MKIEEAMAIVYDLASQNVLDESHKDDDLAEEYERQKLALDTVHDFIVNNMDEADKDDDLAEEYERQKLALDMDEAETGSRKWAARLEAAQAAAAALADAVEHALHAMMLGGSGDIVNEIRMRLGTTLAEYRTASDVRRAREALCRVEQAPP
jgi:predicted RND superfamily exporter protein